MLKLERGFCASNHPPVTAYLKLAVQERSTSWIGTHPGTTLTPKYLLYLKWSFMWRTRVKLHVRKLDWITMKWNEPFKRFVFHRSCWAADRSRLCPNTTPLFIFNLHSLKDKGNCWVTHTPAVKMNEVSISGKRYWILLGTESKAENVLL